MATKIEDLRAKVADAQARAEAAQKAGDEAAEVRAVDDEAAAQAELADALVLAAKLAGARMMRAHRPAAKLGGYQIGPFDLRAKLPQLDDARFPNGGMVLFRSPTKAVSDRYEVENAEGSAVKGTEAAVNYICACTVEPAFAPDDPAALRYRSFWETDGRGLLVLAGLEIQGLGGFRLEAFKRVSK